MIEVNKFFFKIFFLIFFVFSTQVESKVLSIGSNDAKVTIKVFSSLTCPHCANFHTNVYWTFQTREKTLNITILLYRRRLLW